MSRVSSAEKQLAMVTKEAGRKAARSLRPEKEKKKQKKNLKIKLHYKHTKQGLKNHYYNTTQCKFP